MPTSQPTIHDIASGVRKKSTPSNQDIETERSLLTSGLGAAEATRDFQVPVIDMSRGTDDEIAQQLWEAARTVGFFTVVGHDIPQDLIEQAFQASAAFFRQSQSAKESQSPFCASLNSGYEYMSQVRPSTGTPDQKESLQITARKGAMDDRWPHHPSNFQQVSQLLMTRADQLAQWILDLLEPRACPEMASPGTLANSHTLWAPDGQCTLRLLHYPPMDAETCEQLTGDQQYWRAGPHTDWCNITLLFQRMGQAGLECCANPHDDTKVRRWTPVDPVEGGIAVNIGDMLSRWSDGRLHSNLHRVRMPTPEECSSSRYSMAFFAQSDKSTVIESKSGTISAGEYILSRLQSNFETTET